MSGDIFFARLRVAALVAGLLFSLAALAGCSMIFTSMPPATDTAARLHSFPAASLPLKQKASIYWDEHQIPFIHAQSDADGAFLLGLVQAHLRMGQMELFRRISQGRTAEIGGPYMFPKLDHALRTIGFARQARKIWQKMPSHSREWVKNFTRGINWYLEHKKPLPHEYEFLGMESEKWTPLDVVTLGRLAGSDVNWIVLFGYLRLQKDPKGKRLWRHVLRLGGRSEPSFASRAKGSLFAALESYGEVGSNSLVVSPRRSKEDGSALMANDPHVGLSLPPLWVTVGLKTPSYHMVGFMVPGLPFVGVGRNRHIAWGGTNMRALSSQLVDLSCLPKDQRVVRVEKYDIGVRWWPDKEVEVRISPYGPIISDLPMLAKQLDMGESQKAPVLALRWIGHDVSDELTSFLRMNRARNWPEFVDSFKDYAVSGMNFVYADDKGNIGQLLAVELPKRDAQKIHPYVSACSKQANSWEQRVNALDLPQAYNPKRGYLASSNNKPTVAKHRIGVLFSSNDRIVRVRSLLEKKERLSLTDLRQIQRDVMSPLSFELKKIIINYFEKNSLHENLSLYQKNQWQVLADWSGEYKQKSRGALLFQLLLYHYVNERYQGEYGETGMMFLYNFEKILSLVRLQLQKAGPQQSKLWQKAWRKAVADSRDFDTWGQMHRLRVSHPFAFLPWWGERYQFADWPSGGGRSTLMKRAHSLTNKKHNTSFGANARHISIVRNPDENYFLLFGGQDGWLNSQDFMDQAKMWRQGRYIYVPLRLNAVAQWASYTTELKASGKH